MGQSTGTHKCSCAPDVDIAPATGGGCRRTSTRETRKAPIDASTSTEAPAARAVSEARIAGPSGQEAGRRQTRGNRIIAFGIALAVLVWSVEAALHALVFDERSFAGQMFAPAAHELWMRGIWVAAIIGFGAYVQRAIHTRERSKDMLRDSEARYRTLSDVTFEGILLSENGIVVDANQQFADMFGYELDELPGMHLTEFVASEDRDLAWSRIGSDDEQHYELRGIRKDGARIVAEVRPRMMSIEGRQARVTIVRDVTESRQAEEELRRRTHDLGERVKELNCLYGISRLATLEDLTVERLLGEAVELLPPAWQYPEITCARIVMGDLEFRTESFAETRWRQSGDIFVAGERAGFVEVSYLQERPEADEGTFLKEERHLIDAIAERLGRIVERRRAEEALLQERNRAQQYLDVAGAMMIALRADETVAMINRSGCETLGYEEQEMVGSNWFDNYLPERMRDGVRVVFRMLMAGEVEPVEFYENPVLTANGEERILFWHNTVLRDEEGKITGCLGSAEDITERRRAEEELRGLYEEEKKLTQQLEAEIDKRVQFTRTLAHELKTPLTPVVVASDMLVERIDDEVLQKVALNLNRGAHNLNSRIDELLDLARGEVGMLCLKTERMDIEALLGEVTGEVEPMLASAGQSLIAQFPSGESSPLPLVCADRVRVKQVVLNLLNNAFKFTPEGGKISVSARQEDSTVVVEVSDSGPGIGAAECRKVFDPYHRVEGDRERFSGLGLGLALARMLVDLHGGRIWVRSRKGRGSTFSFSLPVAGPGGDASDSGGDL